MTIQERLRRSNLVMLVVPVVIAGVLFAAGLGALALLLNAVYLPRLGLTFQDLHSIGEEMEQVFRGLKLFVVLYAAVVLAALLAAVAFTNLYLTRALFAHIQKPLDILLQGVYLPTIQAVHSLLRFQLAVFPGLCALGLGVLMGIAVSIHAIRAALQRSRSAMVWLILGLMLGSLYAIVNGPASLDTPLPALRLATFQLPAFLLGATLLLALEGMKKAMEKTAGKH